MSGYQLVLPNDNEWHTAKITPASGWEANFKTGRFTREPVVGWLLQVKAVSMVSGSGTPATTRVVAGVYCDGAVVAADSIEGFEGVTQV